MPRFLTITFCLFIPALASADEKKPSDAETLRHVLAVVPLVEFVLCFRSQVVPDGDDAHSREAH